MAGLPNAKKIDNYQDTLAKINFKTSERIRFTIAIVTVLLIVLMFPKGESIESEVNVGSIWIHDDLIASFPFPILKDPNIYKAELKEAEASVFPVFVNVNKNGNDIDTVIKYNSFLLKAIDSSIVETNRQETNPSFLSSQSFTVLKNLRLQEKNLISSNGFSLGKFFSLSKNILSNVYTNKII